MITPGKTQCQIIARRRSRRYQQTSCNKVKRREHNLTLSLAGMERNTGRFATSNFTRTVTKREDKLSSVVLFVDIHQPCRSRSITAALHMALSF